MIGEDFYIILHVLADFFHQSRLKLAHSLSCYIIPFAYLALGNRLVCQQPVVQDVQFFFVEFGYDGFEF